ncbi:hypothetical protein CB1_001060007 [Camelus ferus]|nr:hypothetical protein CB1_001060007 [Camelus ferus]
MQTPALHRESWQIYRPRAEGAEVNETAEEEKENEWGTEAEHSLSEPDSESENQYDDLYVFIPGDNPEDSSQEPPVSSRPPLPPPRPAAAAFQLEKPPFPLQDRTRLESQAFSTVSDCLASGQEELILLQEKVKNGKLSVDEALEKFKHWQMGKTGLEVIQQEKLRQLRDCIIGKRPEEENVYNKLTIVHHPNVKCSILMSPNRKKAAAPRSYCKATEISLALPVTDSPLFGADEMP